MAERKRVAIIGGGFSGLSAIRSLKEEGMEPVCYERTSSSGGTWCYREEAVDGVPSIMPTTIINHSKEMGSLSNYPPNKEYANYMRHSELYQYFKDVGEAFDCFRHMIYNREVVSVKRSEDHDETGRWVVAVKNTENQEITSDVFDAVMVCTGHITFPKMYEFPGMEKFKGKIVHTHSIKKVNEFVGQKVCVVGIGCSALDAAVECSGICQQVYLSTRSGSWIFPRVGPYGLPMDYALLRRYITIFQEILPISLSSKYIEKFFLNPKFNHNLYNLRPEDHVLCKDPSVNDGLPSKLISGSVVLRKNIKYFTENGVVFEGENSVTQVDTVIMATGYQWKFPFLEDDIVTTNEAGRINVYKCMWPPHLKHPTLTIIGFVLPFGPGFPLGEVQCRWAALVFKGKLTLPSKDTMMKEVAQRHDDNVKRYRPSDKMSIRVDFIPYMDDIASQFGAKPSLLKLLFTDPKLFQALAFGPSLSYQYRLQGPHKWRGARRAILTSHDRMKNPLSGNVRKTKTNLRFGFLVKYIINLMLISLWISWKDSSTKYYLVAMFLPQFMSWRSFFFKYLFAIMVLPFFVAWNGFLANYFVTLLLPLVIAGLSSL